MSKMMKTLFGMVLAMAMFAIPVVAQDSTDHNDTNSKTKNAVKKAGDKTEDAAKTVGNATKDTAVKTKNMVDKTDINTASKDELMKIKGIGDVYAQKIIDNRPYNSKADLLHKKIIPAATYEKVKNEIIAKQPKTETTTTTTTTTTPK